MGRVKEKKAFVTGAGSGLGRAISEMLAFEGAKVCVTDINLDSAQATRDAINESNGDGAAFAFAHDVTSESEWQTTLEAGAEAMGGMSILVNNAGIGDGGTIEGTSFELWEKVHKVDLDSVFFGCKYALPYMREDAPSSIVNISSIASLIAGHNMAAYNSAKAGVWMLSKSVALHCARKNYNIRCNSVHPSFVDTPILDSFTASLDRESLKEKLIRQIPLGRIGEVNDVAYAVLYLASDESKFVTGSELKVDGGISAM